MNDTVLSSLFLMKFKFKFDLSAFAADRRSS